MHGGKRAGTGRPKGAKTKNAKALLAKKLEQAKTIESAQEIIGDGLTPLRYMIETMRDQTKDDRLRLDAAKAAADYCHRKQPQDHSHSGEVKLTELVVTVIGAAP